MAHCYIRQEPLPLSWLTGKASPPTEETEKFVQPGYHPEFGKKVAECREGSSFGELALMYGHPRAATVLAMEPCTLWSVDRMTFRTIILKAAHRRRTMYEQFLSSVPLLTSLGPEERSKIADALVSRVYSDGDAVVRQGEMGDTFFFVEEGEAIVTKRQIPEGDVERQVQVGHLKKGDYFGGEAYLACLSISCTDPVRSSPRIVPAAPGAPSSDGQRHLAHRPWQTEAQGRGAGRARVYEAAWTAARDHGTQCRSSVRATDALMHPAQSRGRWRFVLCMIDSLDCKL